MKFTIIIKLLFIFLLGYSLEIGELASDFSFTNQNGKIVNLTNIIQNGSTVVALADKADSKSSLKELDYFEKLMKKYNKVNATVVFISSSEQNVLSNIHKEHNLSFDLLSDPEKTILDMWRVPKCSIPWIKPRVTYVLNKNRRLFFKYSSFVKLRSHAWKSYIRCKKLYKREKDNKDDEEFDSEEDDEFSIEELEILELLAD